MRKLMVCFMLAWLLLGRMTIDEWNKIVDKDSFLNGIAHSFSFENGCSSEIRAMTNDEIVFIIGKCSEGKENYYGERQKLQVMWERWL